MTLLERGAAGAVLILAVALLRTAMGRALPRRALGLLWWAAALRLLLPWEAPSRLSVYNLLAAGGQTPALRPAGGGVPARPLPGTVTGGAAAIAPVVPASSAVSPWALVWLAGSLLLALWLAASYLRCRRTFSASLPAGGGYAARWQRDHPRVSVRVSDRVSGPLAYGLVRPVILLPRGMDRGSETALGCILTHEYEHIRHLDGLTKLVLAAALCVHWWNPAVWLMVRLAGRDLELACDEAVVRRLGDPAAYARTLLAVEEARAGICPRFAQSPVEERIKAMMKFQSRRVPVLVTACALLLAVCVTTAFATSAKEPPRNLAERLAESVTCEDGTVSFTIPEGKAEWNLWISGRILADGVDMSVHYLEEESADRSWEPGKIYQFRLEEAVYDELTINGTDGRESIDIDLLAYVPRPEADISAEVEAVWAETLAPYLPLGLEYTFEDPDGDGNGLRMTFQGREVRGIVDGETWITEHIGNGLFDQDAGEVRAVYEGGVLTALEFLSEEEQAAFTEQRESARDMVWPVTDFQCIASAFGPRANPGGQGVTVHDGIDIAAFAGTGIFAVLDGTVTESGFDSARGNYLLVDHGGGLETLYAQCQELCVEAGDRVEQGQVIARVGSTGRSTGPHLHFEVRRDGEVQDPLEWVYGYDREFFHPQ